MLDNKQMSGQEQQQLTFKYLFRITPIEIKTTSKIKNNSSKSILIKLGSKTAKCSQLNTPLELEIDVLYSKTLQKYCPIKGIIKIYDVAEDGSEIISCVGGFQTEELLNEGRSKVILEKEIGTSKLKMDIVILNLTEKKNEKEEKTDNGRIPPPRENSSSREKYMLRKGQSDKQIPNLSAHTTARTSLNGSAVQLPISESRKNSMIMGASQSTNKPMEIPFKNTSSNINKSLEKINQALSFKRFEDTAISTKANEVLAKAQMETLKQQLSDQKRKSSQLQERFNRLNQRIGSYKSTATHCQNQVKSAVQIYKKIIDCLQLGESHSLICQTDDKKRTISIKYKDRAVERALKQFVEYAHRKIMQPPLPTLQGEDANDKQKKQERSWQQLEQAKKEIAILKKLTMQKDKKIYSLQKQMQGVEVTIHNLKETNKHLSEENHYLREKNDQVELSIYHKENAIDSLRKQNDKYAYQLQELQAKLYNSELQIEELREEVSNCNETIDVYREKYGDLKNVKNRAIEQEIKECLRWIDQQNRQLEMSQMEETMQSSPEGERDDNLSSIINHIDHEQ